MRGNGKQPAETASITRIQRGLEEGAGWWGALLDQGRIYASYGPRVALIPGITIMLIVLGANLLGDGLRDRFDPKREVKF